jgi:hypothetical protein
MPRDYSADQDFANRLTREVNRGAYGNLSKPPKISLNMQKTSEDLQKSIAQMLLGPTRDSLTRTYKVDGSGLQAAVQNQANKIDMSGFLLHYQPVDVSRFSRPATESPLVKQFIDDMNTKYGSRLKPPTSDSEDEPADMSETIEEIQQQTTPEVVQAFRDEVLTPSVEHVLEDLDTEITDADYEALDAVFAEITDDDEDAVDELPDLDTDLDAHTASIVAKLRSRYPQLTDRQLGKGVTIFATSAGILLAASFFPVVLGYILAYATLVGGMYGVVAFHEKKKSD